jgi:hypothetical protein
MRLTATLVADGSSDRLLKPILEWLLSQYLSPAITIDIQVPEWGLLPIADRLRTLPERLVAARRLFAADVYFIHRDTEKYGTWQERQQEIDAALQRVFRADLPPYVRVIPVQMTETWLLHNEAAIREAAENPNGREPVNLPPVARLEALPEAKTRLLEILRTASGLTGRRRQKFEANERRRLHRLAALQQEQGFAVLRALPAFQLLEQEIRRLADGLAT